MRGKRIATTRSASGLVPHKTVLPEANTAARRQDTSRKGGVPASGVYITEKAIEQYGARVIGLYCYVAHRCGNGVVYQYGPHIAQKLDWGKTKFYHAMGVLVHHGLAVKMPWGHYHLSRRRDVIGLHKGSPVKHRCLVKLEEGDSERDVRDAVLLKLVEKKHRQVAREYAPPPEGKKSFKAQRIKMSEESERVRYGRPSTQCPSPSLGEGKEQVAERVRNGFAPINSERLMEVTSLGRVAMFSWKKRAKAKGWIQQEDRFWRIPPEMTKGLPTGIRDLEVSCLGKVSESRSLGYLFHQASCYKLLLTYGG